MKEKIEKYFRQELDGQEHLEVQMYIAENPGDPTFNARCESIFDNGRSGGAQVEDALNAVHRRIGLSEYEHSRKIWRSVAVAAMLLILPLAGGLIVLAGRGGEAEYRQIRVPNCQTRTVTLSDGSVLTLAPGTELTYPDRFNGKERTVFLDGQLFADISSDRRHPFVINSGDVSVRVHGTRFNFKSYSDAEHVELRLVEGSVSVGIDKGTEREIAMKPGEMLRYNRVSDEYNVSGFDREEAAATGALLFNNESLGEICQELERHFGVQVVILDEELAGKRFYSYFTNGESVDRILSVLAGRSMKVSRQNENLIFVSAR